MPDQSMQSYDAKRRDRAMMQNVNSSSLSAGISGIKKDRGVKASETIETIYRLQEKIKAVELRAFNQSQEILSKLDSHFFGLSDGKKGEIQPIQPQSAEAKEADAHCLLINQLIQLENSIDTLLRIVESTSDQIIIHIDHFEKI